MNNYLIKLLENYKKENNLKNTEIAAISYCNKVDIGKYLKGKISITKTLLDRLNIKPDKVILRNELITMIEKENNINNLIYLYNYLKRNN